MKGIYKRGDIWWFRYSVEGKQQFMSLDTREEWEAVRRAEQLIASPLVRDIAPMEVNVERYLSHDQSIGRLSPNSVSARRHILNLFVDFAQGKQTSEVIERWDQHLRTTTADITRSSYLRVLKRFFDYMVETRRLRENPLKVRIDYRPYSPRKPFCSKEQVQALIQAADSPQLRFILYAGFHAGLRREEIVQARPHWFDLGAGLLHVQRSDTWKPKDRNDRTIPLTDEFHDFLRHSYGLRSPFMIAPEKKETGKWRYRYDFRLPFMTLIDRLRVVPAVTHGKSDANVTIHCMRHTFASLRVSAGVSLYKVANWLGDGMLVTERHYGFLIPQDSQINV